MKTIDAQKLWFAIVESQIETGTPYMLYKVCFVAIWLACVEFEI